MSDIEALQRDGVEKKPAPPSNNPIVQRQIVDATKQQIKNEHPNDPSLLARMFRGADDEFQFEQSLQPFYSTAATTIPNNQNFYADFLYGTLSSSSCKSQQGKFKMACLRNNARLNLY